MTTLNTTQELWKLYSMSPYEETEKIPEEKVLWPLLMPWEIGRCAMESNGRHVDVQNVIWLATSNLGHDLVFDHHEARNSPDEFMSREEYVELMGLLRPRVSERLGASIDVHPFSSDNCAAFCSFHLGRTASDLL